MSHPRTPPIPDPTQDLATTLRSLRTLLPLYLNASHTAPFHCGIFFYCLYLAPAPQDGRPPGDSGGTTAPPAPANHSP